MWKLQNGLYVIVCRGLRVVKCAACYSRKLWIRWDTSSAGCRSGHPWLLLLLLHRSQLLLCLLKTAIELRQVRRMDGMQRL